MVGEESDVGRKRAEDEDEGYAFWRV